MGIAMPVDTSKTKQFAPEAEIRCPICQGFVVPAGVHLACLNCKVSVADYTNCLVIEPHLLKQKLDAARKNGTDNKKENKQPRNDKMEKLRALLRFAPSAVESCSSPEVVKPTVADVERSLKIATATDDDVDNS